MSHGIFWPHPRRLREQQKQYWSPLATTTVVTVAVAAAKHDGQQHDTEGRELMQAASPNHNVTLPNPSSSEETARMQKPALV